MTINNNLISNYTFGSGTLTGWTGFASGVGSTAPTVSVYSDSIFSGYSAKVVTTDVDDSGLISASGYRVELAKSVAHTFSAYVKIPSGSESRNFAVRIEFYNQASGGTSVSYQSTPRLISSLDNWVRLSVTATTTGSNYYASGFIYLTDTEATIGDTFLVDGIKLEVGNEATEVAYEQLHKNRLTDRALQPVYIDHLKGMKLKADIRLGDFVFNRIDEYGVVWVITDIQGWHNLPGIEIQDLPRGWGDGSFDAYGRYTSRAITIAGTFLVQDPDTQLEPARERLINAVNLVKKDAWLVMGETVPKASRVRLSGSPELSTVNPRGRTDFSIGLVAADPIKYQWSDARDDGYALEVVEPNQTEPTKIVNNGNTPVPVIFEVIGPTTGPTSIYNKTSDELMDIIDRLNKYTSVSVVATSVTDNVAQFFTSTPHGLADGDIVDVLDVADIFGIQAVSGVSPNTLSITANVKHSFTYGQRVYLAGVTALEPNLTAWTNGEYIISSTSNASDYIFTVQHANANVQITTSQVSGTPNSNFSVYSNVNSVAYEANNKTATFTYSGAGSHGFMVGDQVVVSNVNNFFNGTHIIDEVISNTIYKTQIFSSQHIANIKKYSRENSLMYVYVLDAEYFSNLTANDYLEITGLGVDFNGVYKFVNVADYTGGYKKIGLDNISNEVISVTDTNSGTVQLVSRESDISTASVSGRAYYGNIFNSKYVVKSAPLNASVFTVDRQLSYNIPATTTLTTFDGDSTPTARYYNEILSVDTLNREVALDGEIGGYRGKLETLVDWIYLVPGENEITFTDKNKIQISYVQYTLSTNTALVSTKTDHNFVIGSTFKISGVSGIDSTVFPDTPEDATLTVTVLTDKRSFGYQPLANAGANVAFSTVANGFVAEDSNAYLNIYYRSGWIG